MAKGKRGLKFDNIVNSAVQDGIDSIMKNHPRFKENQEFIYRHIDKKRLNQVAGEAYELLKKQPSEGNIKEIYEGLANYVASGGAFDDAGKEIILKKGLEEKSQSGFFRGLFARRELKGEKYLDNLMSSFQDLYTLFKTGDYAQRMPELAEAITTVNDMGFLDPAVDVLKHYGLINEKRYNILKKGIKERTAESAEKAVSGVEKYIMPQQVQKAVAIILSFIGILFIGFSGNNITGNVIGNLPNTSLEITGAALILFSLILFLTGKKK